MISLPDHLPDPLHTGQVRIKIYLQAQEQNLVVLDDGAALSETW